MITVIDSSNEFYNSPTITVENVEAETIGYSIDVPVTLSIGILEYLIISSRESHTINNNCLSLE